jgi:isopentenyldiphosphate isomerase
MELIDVVTPAGRPTGVSKIRDRVHADGDWHRTVHVWIMNAQRELLLQRRANTKESHAGMWDVSCAGHIPAGNGSRHAAVRELREELGLRVRPEELRFMFTVPSFFSLHDDTFVDRELVDVYLLPIDVRPSVLRLQPEEVEAVALVPLETLRARVMQADATVVPHKYLYPQLFEFLGDQARLRTIMTVQDALKP